MKYTVKRDGLNIAITQYTINGWDLSYNPDDNRFYVTKGTRIRIFQRWTNATYYAKRHN